MPKPVRPQTSSEKPFDICQRTFEFAVRVVNLCIQLDQKPGASWTLSKQLLRSGTSIGANIEEGQAAQSKPDFIAKYSIARKRPARPAIGSVSSPQRSGLKSLRFVHCSMNRIRLSGF